MKVTLKQAIDYSSISNINRLINIDWYLLTSILIDYRFDRLSTLGINNYKRASYKMFALDCSTVVDELN